MKAYVTNIERATLENQDYRRVLFTGPNTQLVLMTLAPGEAIGLETHADHDQFIRVEAGIGIAVLDGMQHPLRDGTAVVIPAGVEHNIMNTSKEEPMRLYTLYSPPEHPQGTVHRTKQDEPAHGEPVQSGAARMKKILCATDFSLRSELAVDRAAMLARQFAAEVVLLHAVDDDEPRPMVDRRSDEARIALVARVEDLRKRGNAEVSVDIRVGNAFAAIVEAARASDADLIVMGAPRRRLLHEVIAGTTIERVLRTGGHPVLMVNAAALLPYESVLVALDASDASARAARAAKELGLLDGTVVSAVHAFEPIYKGMMSWAGLRQETVDQYSAAWARDEAKELHRFLASIGLADAISNVMLEEGPPFLSIKKVVERTRPHLLVIGTRGHTGFKRLLLGSVAERVVSEIECDILAVPPIVEGGR